MKKRIVIAGGTGFIGRNLAKELLKLDYEVIVLTRSRTKGEKIFSAPVILAEWDGSTSNGWGHFAENAHAIINLSGESVAGWRWNQRTRKKIIDSRVNSVRAMSQAIIEAKKKPQVLIQASAIGYYGAVYNKAICRESTECGDGFLAEIVYKWEKEVNLLSKIKMNKIIIRTGVVLSLHEGMLSKLYTPFRFFTGGHFGSGKQYLSWIHERDTTRAIIFLLNNKKSNGVYNLTAPNPVTAEELSKALGSALGRPSWMNIPSFMVKLIFGQMGDEILLKGQYAVPDKLIREGFKFEFTDIRQAIADLLRRERHE